MKRIPLPLQRWVASTPDKPWRNFIASQAPALRRKSDFDLMLTNDYDQIWAGFGGCFNELGWIALQKMPAKERIAFFQELFDASGDFRFNICRLPIGASDYASSWYSHNETPGDFGMKHFSIARDRKYLLPYIKQALKWQPHLKLFASPWSPPAWMKQPASYNYGTLVWDKKYLSAYALYLLKFIQAYSREGVPIHQIHIQNEPNSDQKFPSCLWTGEKFRDFIRDHLGPGVRKSGIDLEIWAGTIERGDYAAWLHTILSDPKAAAYIAGLGFQWAGKEMVQRAHASWPEFPKMQTENECGDGTNTWTYATYVFDLFQHYLSNGINAYIYWNMVLEPGGLSTWGWKQNALFTADPVNRRLIRNPEYYVMRHYSAFLRPGARRIRLRGRWSALATAFENPGGSTVVILRNPSQTLQNLRLQRGNDERVFTLPANSFHTFVLPRMN